MRREGNGDSDWHASVAPRILRRIDTGRYTKLYRLADGSRSEHGEPAVVSVPGGIGDHLEVIGSLLEGAK